ncbi:MAG TPA: hypothetical protein VFN10_13095 [Thermoanaerobaculia bacterium]|nr:hypothetical protein [Thermoanaerobaculia bacterium]
MSGQDYVGWALDVQRKYLIDGIHRLGHRVVKNPFFADAVISVHWLPLTNWRYTFFRWKRVATLATNYINLSDPEYPYRAQFEAVNARTVAWIAPSRRQLEEFERHGVRAFYQPFYVEEFFFRPQTKTRRELCEAFGIDYARVEGRVVIGSIQRDTEGHDLSVGKWSKGPHLIVELLRSLPDKEKYVLLLAGPRRHWILQQCREHGIPYVYAGNEPAPGEDDIASNLLPAEQMPDLYSLTDLYLVTSPHEGGPKSILEATLMRTLILSTDVGLVRDFLEPDCVFANMEEYKAGLRRFVDEFPTGRFRGIADKQYETAHCILNERNMDALLQSIIEGICNG